MIKINPVVPHRKKETIFPKCVIDWVRLWKKLFAVVIVKASDALSEKNPEKYFGYSMNVNIIDSNAIHIIRYILFLFFVYERYTSEIKNGNI